MSITSYLLDDLDVDPETKRVLGVALEKTRVSLGLQTILPTESSPSDSSNLPRPASIIPICYARAQSSNCAGIYTGTDRRPDPTSVRPALTLSALPTLLSFSFLPSRLLAST